MVLLAAGPPVVAVQTSAGERGGWMAQQAWLGAGKGSSCADCELSPGEPAGHLEAAAGCRGAGAAGLVSSAEPGQSLPCARREQLVEQFPLKEGQFNKVPKIATAADE